MERPRRPSGRKRLAQPPADLSALGVAPPSTPGHRPPSLPEVPRPEPHIPVIPATQTRGSPLPPPTMAWAWRLFDPEGTGTIDWEKAKQILQLGPTPFTEAELDLAKAKCVGPGSSLISETTLTGIDIANSDEKEVEFLGTDQISVNQLAAMFVSGSAEVVRNREFLNKINLFPIPDADTGNNMGIAFRAFASTCEQAKVDGLGCLKLCQELGLSMLMNGQGNSGTISTYFFNKLAAALDGELNGQDAAEIPVVTFAKALEGAGAAMAQAMDKPKEGTMISVIRDSCTALCEAASAGGGTVGAWLSAYQERAQTSLLKTPDQLEVDGKFILKDAGVDFDSGAKGYVLFIDGMVAAASGKSVAMAMKPVHLSGTSLGDEIDVGHEAEEVAPGASLAVPENRFCTEFLVNLPDDSSADEALIRLELSKFGDSIVPLIARKPTGGKLLKAHIHTNDPEAVWAFAGALPGAELLKTKADDMLMQVAPHFPPPTREELDGTSFRIIIYSTNAFALTSIAARYEWGFVPARVTVDGESYKDLVEISAATVFNNYRTNPDFKMGTGGSTIGDMLAGLKKELDKTPKKPVVIVTLAFLLSGGTKTAIDGAKQLLSDEERARLHIFEAPGMWPNEGQAVLKLNELALAGTPYDEAFEAALSYCLKADGLLVVSTCRYLVAGGRLPAAMIADGDLCMTFKAGKGDGKTMGSPDWGKLLPAAKPVAADKYLDQCDATLDTIEANIKASDTPDAQIRFLMTHTGKPHLSLPMEKKIKARFNVKDITTLMFSPIVGVHTGAEMFYLGWSFE